MSTKLHGLRTAIYFVDNIAAATKWYSAAFGIEPYFNEPFYVGFNVGGYELGLHPGAGKDAKTGKDGVNTYWGVDDARAVYDALIAAGATSHEQPNDVGGGIMVAAVKDPWGNVLGVIQNPHFKIGG